MQILSRRLAVARLTAQQRPLCALLPVSAPGATKTLLLCVFIGGGLSGALGAKPDNGPADCGRSMF